MKKIELKTIIVTLAYLLISTLSFGQAPQKMSYQAVIRNASNALVMNTTVGMQISILQGSEVGTPVYVETQTPTTNSNGLASLQIGNGVVVSGTFATIDWATGGPYFIKTETDPLGGIVYTITGTSQMLSTPYSLYAEKSGGLTTPLGKSHLILTGDISDAQAAIKIANEVGPNTQFVWIQNTTALTTVNLSSISELAELRIMNNSVMNTLNLNGLTNISGTVGPYGLSAMSISDNPLLTSLSFPLLTKAGGSISIMTCPLLNSCTFLSLTEYAESFTMSNTSIVSFSMPQLVKGGLSGFQINTNPLLTSISLPLLQRVGMFLVGYNPMLSSVSIPAFNALTFSNTLFVLDHNALPVVQVNSLLIQLLSVAPVAGKSIYLNAQTPLAPPSGAGITAKATLISNGNTVQTD
jgi:hypothetical protein